MIKNCEENCGIDAHVTKFVLPIATITNRDGSVIFVASSVIFVAQTYAIDFDVGRIIVIG